MVYKVVSTKLADDEYTMLVESCNREGVSVSFMVKDSIMMRIDPDYLMNRFIEMMDGNPEFFTQVSDKIKEKNKERSELTLEQLAKELEIKLKS